MAVIDADINKSTIDSLRNVQLKLFSISESELDAMGQEKQVEYGDRIHQNDLAILKLEAAKLKQVNDEFKNREQELKKAAGDIEKDLAQLTDAVKIVKVVSEGMSLVTDIIKLLG